MRKEFSTISVLTMGISLVAGVVLCMQLAQVKGVGDFQPPSLVVWGAQLALFGTAVFVWRRDTSLLGWVLGIGALLGVRMVLSAISAEAMSMVQSQVGFEQAWTRVGALTPVGVAAVFAVVIGYPLRARLPANLTTTEARIEVAPAKKETVAARAQAPSPGRAQGWAAERAPAVEEEPRFPNIIGLPPSPPVHGEMELPLRAILKNVPANLITESAREYGNDFPVAIPLPLIVPQLREGQILIPLEKLDELLPPGVLAAPESTGLEGEPTLVSLALEEVVPNLPPGVLELPPPSPPAWAALPDLESVVFATV